METDKPKLFRIAVVYAIVVWMVISYLNYVLPYDPDTPTKFDLEHLLFWSLLYLPVIVLPAFANWKLRDFGLGINGATILAALLVVGMCGSMVLSVERNLAHAATEAFARSGEEIFFRGFVYLLLEKVFSNRKHPWLWALFGSSIVFVAAHTSAFQESYLSQREQPALYVALERILNVFLLAVGFGTIRAVTGSVIPTALAHCLVNGGILTLPFVLATFAIGILVGRLRGENMIGNLFRFSQ
ncbi:MAG: CPBP family intramembrane metalloprotease [Anaerolineae bacterium]|nr:CPBP family intramembrane metalloprotease [Anaerolineae bacterium]